MDYAALYKNVGKMAEEKPWLPKVRLKDAWGSRVFMVLGNVPGWVRDIPAPDFKGNGKVSSTTLKSMTFETFVRDYVGGKFVTVTERTNMVVMDGPNKVADVVKLISKTTQPILVQKKYLDLMEEVYGKPLHLEIAPNSFGVKVYYPKGSLRAVIASITTTDNQKLMTPIEAVRERLKERKK